MTILLIERSLRLKHRMRSWLYTIVCLAFYNHFQSRISKFILVFSFPSLTFQICICIYIYPTSRLVSLATSQALNSYSSIRQICTRVLFKSTAQASTTLRESSNGAAASIMENLSVVVVVLWLERIGYGG